MPQNYYRLGRYRVQESRAADGALLGMDNGQIEYIPGRLTITEPDGWDDLVLPAAAVNPSGLTSPPAWDSTESAWKFADNANKRIDFVWQMPHRWKEGTSVKFHIHYFLSGSGGGNTYWKLNYRVWNINGAKPSWSGTEYITLATPGSTNHVFGAIKTITMSGKTISCIVQAQLTREGGSGSDTYSGDVYLLSADLHYQSDVMTGSAAEATK
jgi:hypothetical protein